MVRAERTHPLPTKSAVSRQGRWQLYTFLLALGGFLGTLLSILSLYQPECQKGVIYPVAMVVFCIACGMQLLPKWRGRLTFASLLLLLLYLFFQAEALTAGVQFFVNTFYRMAHHTDIAYFSIPETFREEECVTTLLFGGSSLLAFFFAFFTMNSPRFFPVLLVPFLLLEPGLFWGLNLSPMAFAPLLACWVGMLILRLTETPYHKKYVTISHTTAARCGLLAASVVFLLYGLVTACGSFFGFTRTQADWTRRNQLKQLLTDPPQALVSGLQWINNKFDLFQDDETVSLGNRSSIIYADDEMLTITCSALPENTIYLKGYTGSVYENNHWYASTFDDSVAFSDTIYSIQNQYDCDPQNFPYLFQRTITPEETPFSCTVLLEEPSTRCYQPYFSMNDQMQYANDLRAIPSDYSTYSWSVLPQNSISLINELENVPLTFTNLSVIQTAKEPGTTERQFLDLLQVPAEEIEMQSRITFGEAAHAPQDVYGKVIPAMLMEGYAYRNFAQDAYLQLPESDELMALFQSLPETFTYADTRSPAQQYEMLETIRTWMSERTSYTTSPGRTPNNRDFANFFLLENQKGYCVHYATAGTILARYVGIPARYCEGFVVENDMWQDAVQTENDDFQITLTDRQSHAWCEFYIDGFGWIPFEMTPGYDASSLNASQSATTLTTSVPAGIAETITQTVTATSSNSTSQMEMASGTSTVSTAATTSAAQTKTTSNSERAWLYILLVPAGGVLLIEGIGQTRKFARKRREQCLQNEKETPKAMRLLYREMTAVMQLVGIKGENTLTSDYQARILYYCQTHDLPIQAPELIFPMILAMDFGNQIPTQTQIQQASEALQQLIQAIYAACSVPRRIYMKYILHLL